MLIFLSALFLPLSVVKVAPKQLTLLEGFNLSLEWIVFHSEESNLAQTLDLLERHLVLPLYKGPTNFVVPSPWHLISGARSNASLEGARSHNGLKVANPDNSLFSTVDSRLAGFPYPK